MVDSLASLDYPRASISCLDMILGAISAKRLANAMRPVSLDMEKRCFVRTEAIMNEPLCGGSRYADTAGTNAQPFA